MMKHSTAMNSGKKTIVACLWMAVLSIAWSSNNAGVFVQGMGEKTSSLPLTANTPISCDEMIILHRWEGSCCSLNATNGGGCILNVFDGYCNVKGQEWTLKYNSTYDKKPCPPSEFTDAQLGNNGDPTLPPSGSSSRFTTKAMVVLGASIFAALL